MGLAQTWLREGTGAISIDVPVDTPNARAAADSFREIRGAARGRRRASARITCATIIRTIRANAADDPAELSEDHGGGRPLRPVAGGSRTVDQQELFRKQAVPQFRLRHQRNLAAMVDNPSDLVQPRARNPRLYAAAQRAFEKYRKGTSTTTTYPEADKAKLSDTGK
jgi:pilus assembly protein CpaD